MSGRFSWKDEEPFLSLRRNSLRATLNSLLTAGGSPTSRTSLATSRSGSSHFRAREARSRSPAEGGPEVRWRQDGREIFYLAPDNRILAVPIGLDSSGDLRIGAPVSLFAPNLSGKPRQIGSRHYDLLSRRSTFPDRYTQRSHDSCHGRAELEVQTVSCASLSRSNSVVRGRADEGLRTEVALTVTAPATDR